MNAKEWAEKFDGLTVVDKHLMSSESDLRQDHMLVICGGADGLIETYGAMRLVEGACDGATYYLDRNGFHRFSGENRVKVRIDWRPKDESSEIISLWIVSVVAFPHAMFRWMEEGEIYCWCAIICTDDLPSEQANSTYEKGFKDGIYALLSYMAVENSDVGDIDNYMNKNGELEETFFENLKKY